MLVDGDTAYLGKGWFFTARGDSGYLYSCRPTVVTAVVEPRACYNTVEVKLTNREEQLYSQYNGPNKKEAEGKRPELHMFFLEPKTHLLVTTATEEQCLDALLALYENLHGKWISVKQGGIGLALSPATLEDSIGEKLQVCAAGNRCRQGRGL